MAQSCMHCGSAQQPGARCGQCGTSTAPPDLLVDPRSAAGNGPAGATVISSYGPVTSDVLPSQPRRTRRWTGRTAAVGAAALLAVGVSGAVYAATALSGGGAQPEDVLPADAVGFLKLDLDPAAGQKVAAYRLAQQFPDSGVRGEDSLRDDLIGRVLDGEDQADYDAHVKPWLGQRAGVAFLAPTADDPEELVAVLAVQVTDRDDAEAGLTALAAEEREDGSSAAFGFPDGEDYVLLAEDQAVVDQALRGGHLSDDADFRRSVDALDGDQIALGWMDVAAAWQAVPESERQRAREDADGLDPTGQVVLGVSVASDGVEMVAKSLDLSLGSTPELRSLADNAVGKGRATGLVQQLPADSLAAFSVTGLGPALSDLYTTYGSRVLDEEDVQTLRDETGLRLPDDLRALLGEEMAVAVGGDLNENGVRLDASVRSEDGARAVELIEKARDLAADEDPAAGRLAVQRSDSGYTLGYNSGGSPDTLGEADLFRRTVPDASTSGITAYVDIRRTIAEAERLDDGSTGLTDVQRRNLEPVRAAGYTATVDDGGNATMRLRVAVGD